MSETPIQHSRPGIEDAQGSEIMWREIVGQARTRFPEATSKYSDFELAAELRDDPQTCKVALGLAPSPAIANGILYVPEGGYLPPRIVIRFSEER